MINKITGSNDHYPFKLSGNDDDGAIGCELSQSDVYYFFQQSHFVKAYNHIKTYVYNYSLRRHELSESCRNFCLCTITS